MFVYSKPSRSYQFQSFVEFFSQNFIDFANFENFVLGILEEGVPNLRILHTVGDAVGSMLVPIGVETAHIPANFKETC